VKNRPDEIQRKYYESTASDYDFVHLSSGDEHFLALNYLDALIKFKNFKSILDLGAGTGRAALFLKERNPDLKILSIEPVKELREIGLTKGLNHAELIDGDIYDLKFGNSSFDLVCAFGVFHHLENPVAALTEMQRVSSNSIFISDSNNFGHGKTFSKTIKQVLNFLKIWNFAVLVKTRGKKFAISEGDGLAYSFSLFSLIRYLESTHLIYFLGTVPSKRNLYRSASHLAIFAEKKSN
jgi:ubiquinone/menaquinone biosynthesis C-methylase UbiE